ncbi:hypothetical protein KSF78_0000789 [Schistosoma japonicum]|nr:hypothetical protein KSF78_0000789 [Schistosoma japonicum]
MKYSRKTMNNSHSCQRNRYDFIHLRYANENAYSTYLKVNEKCCNHEYRQNELKNCFVNYYESGDTCIKTIIFLVRS